jgi:hypothetical protein
VNTNSCKSSRQGRLLFSVEHVQLREEEVKEMAVVTTAKDSILVVSYQIGLTEAGAPMLRQRSFPNVRVQALDQDVYDVAAALYGLQEYPLASVRRDNRFDMISQ